MRLMTYKMALANAVAAGATVAEIEAEAVKHARHKGTVPFKNMIVALHLMTHLNDRNDWVRLAAALKVRNTKGARA